MVMMLSECGCVCRYHEANPQRSAAQRAAVAARKEEEEERRRRRRLLMWCV